jgi:hypothetical protein
MLTLIYGGITHHYLASNLPYCNRINNVGTIHNEYVIMMIGNKNKIGVLKGKDSACGDIVGPISSFQISENVDFMLGGYNTNFDKFRKIGIEPPSYNGITPVIGFDFKIPVYKKDNFKVSLDNLVSIGIITHAISVSF